MNTLLPVTLIVQSIIFYNWLVRTDPPSRNKEWNSTVLWSGCFAMVGDLNKNAQLKNCISIAGIIKVPGAGGVSLRQVGKKRWVNPIQMYELGQCFAACCFKEYCCTSTVCILLHRDLGWRYSRGASVWKKSWYNLQYQNEQINNRDTAGDGVTESLVTWMLHPHRINIDYVV